MSWGTSLRNPGRGPKGRLRKGRLGRPRSRHHELAHQIDTVDPAIGVPRPWVADWPVEGETPALPPQLGQADRLHRNGDKQGAGHVQLSPRPGNASWDEADPQAADEESKGQHGEEREHAREHDGQQGERQRSVKMGDDRKVHPKVASDEGER